MKKDGSLSTVSRFIRNIKLVFSDSDRKPLFTILKEFLILSLKTKCIATHYFTGYLYTVHVKNYKDYLCHNEWHLIQKLLTDEVTNDITGDKLYFHEYFAKAGISLPILLGFNIKEKLVIVVGEKCMSREIVTRRSTGMAIQELLAASRMGALFIKPMRGTEGQGIRKVSFSMAREQPEMIDRLHEELLSGYFVFQDEVVQHEALNVLQSGCVNTVRIDTFKEPGEKPEILSAILRIGKRGGYVDNISAGGTYIAIDIENGTLKGLWFRKFGKGQISRIHSETNMSFEEFQLPYFEDVKRMAVEAASWLPRALAGWDIAITNSGPVLIECNTGYYDMSLQDIAYGGYRKNPIYQKAVDCVGKSFSFSLQRKVNRMRK